MSDMGVPYSIHLSGEQDGEWKWGGVQVAKIPHFKSNKLSYTWLPPVIGLVPSGTDIAETIRRNCFSYIPSPTPLFRVDVRNRNRLGNPSLINPDHFPPVFPNSKSATVTKWSGHCGSISQTKSDVDGEADHPRLMLCVGARTGGCSKPGG